METKDKQWTFQTIREEWNEMWNCAVAVKTRNHEASVHRAMWLIMRSVTEKLWWLNTQKSIYSIVRRKRKVAYPSQTLASSAVVFSTEKKQSYKPTI